MKAENGDEEEDEAENKDGESGGDEKKAEDGGEKPEGDGDGEEKIEVVAEVEVPIIVPMDGDSEDEF